MSIFVRYFRALAVLLLAVVAAWRPAAAEESKELATLAIARGIVSDAKDLAYRHWLRDRLWKPQDAARYGLHLDDDWRQAAADSPDSPLVVVIHGFNSTPARHAGVLAAIREAHFPCGVFAYPNDRALADSALFLSRELKQLAAERPEVRVALVTHSMGGLIARACVEDPALDPRNVDRMLMIAPPTHGSLIAHTAFGCDLWEHWLARRDGGFGTRWRESVVDGLGEASDDLVPGSPFLERLNARARHPSVRYAIFLGTRTGVYEFERKLLRWSVEKSASRVKILRNFTGEIDNVLADMDEIVNGKGDGVVALKRGRLEGVDDVVVLPFDHIECTGEPDDHAVQRLHTELLARLQ
jgi:pimeloyl-ACP methyl ester carboxylesterase